MPVRADPPDQQLGLHRTGPVHDDHPAGVVTGHRGVRGRRGRGALPAAEGGLQQGRQIGAGEVADHHHGGGRGPHVPLVEGPDRGPVDGLDRLGAAAARAGEPVGGVEQRGVQRLGGPPGRVGLLVHDLVQPVGDQPLDLVLRQRRAAQRGGQQVQAAGQPGGRDLQRNPDARVVGVRVQGGAGPLQLGRELLGRQRVGALAERPGQDRGDAVQALRLGGERGVEQHVDGHQLLAGAVAVQHRDAVAEGGALRRRERPRGGRAGLGLLVESHGGDVLGAHTAAPSSSVSAVAAVSAAVSSAVVGSYTRTARFCGCSRAAATARTSSAVTSRTFGRASFSSFGSPNSTA